ncbi:VOC family protein [Paenibacillus sp. NPDC058071]|uniref:VOC family protein n=1 Tax=Paenibacillus sp. NPDC058071 TaxID=3346326 RepID=UPI0036DD35D5
MDTMLEEKLSDLTANIENYVTETNDGLSLYQEHHLDKTYVLTPRAYKVPVRIEAVARTDSSNIRLKYAKGQIIFNWERNHDSLRCGEPSKGGAYNNMNGSIPVDEWNHFVWEVEPDFMRVTVNGTERLFLEGKFSHVKGQAGIGSAFRSKVDVKSFRVAGEETDLPPEPLKPLMFEYDETHISVPEGSLETAIQWYELHLGLEPKPGFGPCLLHPSMKGTLMQFPNERGSLQLITVEEDQEHFRVIREQADHFCFPIKAKDISAAYTYAGENGIRTSRLFEERGETWFHLYDPYGNRLTVTQGKDSDAAPTGSGIYGCDTPIVVVSNLERSVEWYTKVLGLKKSGRLSGARHALMRGNYRHSGGNVNILQLIHGSDCSNSAASRPGVRQYFFVERQNLKKAYQKAQKWSTLISPLEDRSFHFYDPDGNRINIFS